MSLDAVWRIPFLSPEVNSAITQTAYETIKEVVRIAEEYRVFKTGSLKTFISDISIYTDADISSIKKLLTYRYSDLCLSDSFKKFSKLNNILRLCEDEGKKLGVSNKIRGKIYQRSQRLREICLILEELISFRNFSSHHTYQRNDLGLSLKVSSSLLRYIEILDLPIKWKKEMQLIRDCSIEMVNKVYEIDPTQELKKTSTFEEKKLTEDKTDTEILNQLKILKDELFKINNNLQISEKTNDFKKEKNEIIELNDLSDEFDQNNEFRDTPEELSFMQLKQQLMEIRKKINKEFKLTSDEQNILSEQIIDNILQLGVNKLSSWKSLHTTSSVQVNNPESCNKQLEKYWDEIEILLKSINWDKQI